VAKHPALDFLNTELVEQGEVVDRLQSPADFAAWLLAAGLVTRGELSRLQSRGATKGGELLRAARAFRHTLRNAVDRIVKRKAVPADIIQQVNRVLARGRVTNQVELRKGELRLTVRRELRDPCDLLIPLAEAVSNLLCNADYRYIRKCENTHCILYFYDVSKNHGRRWCSMDACGSQSKARAYYRRKTWDARK